MEKIFWIISALGILWIVFQLGILVGFNRFEKINRKYDNSKK